jgi:phage/conjugal plasmid C-4 type zinc finger TraR family protein
MDQFDRAQELDAHYRRQAMDVWRRGTDEQRQESGRYCEDCENEIPERRRLASPGCRRCITCQHLWEQHHR